MPFLVKPFLFTIVIPSRRVADLLYDAFEGASKAWVSASEPIGWDRPEGHSTPWYDDESFVQSEALSFKIIYDGKFDDEGSAESSRQLGHEDLVRGLGLMAIHAQGSLSKIIAGSPDAIDADRFMQCVVLGEVIYS